MLHFCDRLNFILYTGILQKSFALQQHFYFVIFSGTPMETGLLSQPSTPQAISSHESSPPLTNLRDLGVILTENNTTDHMDIEFDLDKLNARNRVNMRISYIFM